MLKLLLAHLSWTYIQSAPWIGNEYVASNVGARELCKCITKSEREFIEVISQNSLAAPQVEHSSDLVDQVSLVPLGP